MAHPAQQRLPAKKKKTRSSKAAKPTYTARTADKFELYEEAVQSPEADIAFLTRVFKKEHDRIPLSLREDFCGTAFTAATWVKSHKERTAIGLDLHAPTLAYGMKKHIEPLGAAARRVKLYEKDVLETTRPRVDVCVALNFSYRVFKQRLELKKYFQTVKKSLQADGLFALDLNGGPEAFEPLEEETKHDGFTYVWDQDAVDAVTHDEPCSIHFLFPDGTKMRRAFVYDWRLWLVPELKDLLEEVGFRRVDVYWEGYDRKTREGNGVFRKVEKAENDDSWIAFVTAWK